jgi:hypothetical protein
MEVLFARVVSRGKQSLLYATEEEEEEEEKKKRLQTDNDRRSIRRP